MAIRKMITKLEKRTVNAEWDFKKWSFPNPTNKVNR